MPLALHTLILGFDAFDPNMFESLHERGLVPNLAKLVGMRGYARLGVANPPQSEVSWTSIATGLNPGSHGMFDFVHREPSTYALFLSLLPTQRRFGVTRFVRPYSATTIFDVAANRGYPATSLWWPGTFPARPDSPVRTLPGLGTPDLLGRMGVGCLYSADPDAPEKMGKTPVRRLVREGAGRYHQRIIGPSRKKRSGQETLTVPLHVEVKDERRAVLTIGPRSLDLWLGVWSPILELDFRVNRFISVRAITRVILTAISPTTTLYFLPLQLHPLRPLWPYGTPRSFVRRTWNSCGSFLTVGWPQDTTGLEDGCITDDQFLALCTSIFSARAKVLLYHLEQFREGVLASVFDTLDRIQHMYWRDRPAIVEVWCRKLDALVGDVLQRFPVTAGGARRLVILSDHGFHRWDYVVHLNRWLLDHRYMTAAPGNSGDLKQVDWTQTQAYAIGLNSLYLNLEGREGQGVVPGVQRRDVCERIRSELLRWVGPDGRPVVQNLWLNEQVFVGPLAEYGPDLLVGYSPGYRASPETGLGGWQSSALEANQSHWGADHCFDPRSVPGVLFVNRDLADLPHPSYRDVPRLTVDAEPDSTSSGPPPSVGGEDAELIEERLRSLGYL
jgi:predicted AlkP superfamily phosphohydrolase/phosphomutase